MLRRSIHSHLKLLPCWSQPSWSVPELCAQDVRIHFCDVHMAETEQWWTACRRLSGVLSVSSAGMEVRDYSFLRMSF